MLWVVVHFASYFIEYILYVSSFVRILLVLYREKKQFRIFSLMLELQNSVPVLFHCYQRVITLT